MLGIDVMKMSSKNVAIVVIVTISINIEHPTPSHPTPHHHHPPPQTPPPPPAMQRQPMLQPIKRLQQLHPHTNCFSQLVRIEADGRKIVAGGPRAHFGENVHVQSVTKT